MSVGLYDRALTEKIKKWVLDPQMTVTSPDETRRLFQYKADVNGDMPIELPLIAIRRGKSINILKTNKKPTSFDSLTVEVNKNKIKSLSEIPISIDYQIDVYTRYFQEADEYLRNFIFNIINYPTLDIEIPYNEVHYTHTSNIRLVGTVEDNSDIPERLIPGQFTRFTISIQVDDAYLWSVPIRNNLSVDADVQVELKGKE